MGGEGPRDTYRLTVYFIPAVAGDDVLNIISKDMLSSIPPAGKLAASVLTVTTPVAFSSIIVVDTEFTCRMITRFVAAYNITNNDI